ncbi:MAG: hypothetical protein ACRBCT_03005 [Alphaproteobacteria bacterium]
MRIELAKLLEKLGVSYVLSPYETMPWFYYDEATKTTCSAEVRMGATSEDIETEIQLLKEETDEDEDEESGEGDTSSANSGGREQIMWMRATPGGPDQWGPKQLRIKGKSYVNEFGGWEDKGCEFFRACVESLQMGEIPDFDELIEDKMKEDSMYGGGRRGRIGRKSPNVKPGQLLGMKK